MIDVNIEMVESADDDLTKNDEYEEDEFQEEEYIISSPIIQDKTIQVADQVENVDIDNDSLVIMVSFFFLKKKIDILLVLHTKQYKFINEMFCIFCKIGS